MYIQDDPSIQPTSNNLTTTYNKRREATTKRQPTTVVRKAKAVPEPVFDDAPADYNDDYMDHMDNDEPPQLPANPVPIINEPGNCKETAV